MNECIVENFGRRKFWQITSQTAFSEENFGQFKASP